MSNKYLLQINVKKYLTLKKYSIIRHVLLIHYFKYISNENVS